ncbi:MAG: hypothetical protein U0694_28590 [Anaerolineae bacterium]
MPCQHASRFRAAKAGEEAGLTVLMNETHHYEIGITYRDGARCVFVRRRIGDLSAVVAEEAISAGVVELTVQASSAAYTFTYSVEGQPQRTLASGSTRYLSSEVAGGFTGVYFAMYATGNGEASTVPADFDWFEYQPL